MASPHFHDLKIKSVRPQTENGIALTFEVPDALRNEFAFIPGQYLTLRATINGEGVRRSYSICSAGYDDDLEVGIKRVEGGQFSNHAFGLSVGDVVSVMQPQGRFTAKIGGSHNYLLLASGSGITPCLSIAKSVLAGEPESSITMVYGNSAARTVMFRDDIDALKDHHTERFMLTHVMSREEQDVDFLNGRLDGERVEAIAKRGLIEARSYDAIYICGPQEMIKSTSEALRNLGADEKTIHFELFATDESRQRRPAAKVEKAASGASVDILIDGSRKHISADGTQDTILTAAQKAGLDLPFSCAGGMCCTCRCKLVSGEVAMDANYSLQDWEVEAGFVLACQSRPMTDKLVIDFDAQ